MFAKFQRTNSRPTAVSLIQFSLIRYSTLRAIKKYRFKPNLPRLPLPREHANATTKAYAKPRDWSVHGGDTKRIPYKPNSTASRNSQRGGVWTSLRALCKERPTRSGIIKSKRRQSFLLSSHLKFKWDFPKCSFLEEYSSLRKRNLLRSFLGEE